MQVTTLISLIFLVARPEAQIRDFKLFDLQSDEFTNELTALKADYYETKKVSMLEKVFCTVRRYGKRSYDIIADSGKYDLGNNQMEFWGHSRIVTQSGFEVTTPWMEWNIDKKLLLTPHPLLVANSDVQIRGRGGRFDMQRDEVDIHHDAVMDYGDLHIGSKKGDFSFERNQASFAGDVKGKGDMGFWTSDFATITMENKGDDKTKKKKKTKKDEKATLQHVLLKGDVDYAADEKRTLVIRSKELEINKKARKGVDPYLIARGRVKATKMDPSLDMNSENFSIIQYPNDKEDIILNGRVTIRTAKHVGKSERARISLDTKVITLMDRAQMESKGDQLRGEKIVFNLNDDRVVVKQARGAVGKD